MSMNDFIEVLQEKKVRYSVDGDKIFVDGDLDLRDTSITSLPDNLRVRGCLDLRGTSITSLPDNLSIDGNLDLSYTVISRLPDNLNVDGDLDLRYTGISSLPDNLEVGEFLHLHPAKITNIAWRKFWRNGDYTVFAAWINGECCVVDNANIYTLADFFSGAPAADVEQAARECVAELTQRWKTGGCGMSNSPELLQSIQEMHEAGVLADYACQVDPIPTKDGVLLAWFALDLMGRDKDQGNSVCSTTWINVFDCFPELDTPVLGCWFSDNDNFVLGCYVRTYSADAGGWVWAVAEDFGDGHWLFDDDYPVEFWMPLPGKPDLAGGAA